MKISLHLKKQCIQTAAKNRYEMLMRSYFKKHKRSLVDNSIVTGKNTEVDKSCIEKNSKIEDKEKIETEMLYLLFFLENADFAYLRHAYPQLSGIEDILVTIQVNHNSSSNKLNNHAQDVDCRDTNNSCDSAMDSNNINKKEDCDADINDFTILVNNHVLSVTPK